MHKRVLIIDDNRDILEALELILSDAGYSVQTSENGNILDHIDVNNIPHVIILDYLLSGKKGVEIIATLKSHTNTRNIPVILSSAHPNVKNIWKEVGADDFLAKPFSIDDLLKKIERSIPE